MHAHYVSNKQYLLVDINKTTWKENPMSEYNRNEDYFETDDEREDGHADTRHLNFECETFDSIGCDTGVDVAG